MIPDLLRGTHTATIEPYAGQDINGDTWGTAVTGVPCHKQGNRQVVRSASGQEVVSEETVWFDPGTVCPPGSKVTIDGKVAIVITSTDWFTDERLPLDHVEVTL